MMQFVQCLVDRKQTIQTLAVMWTNHDFRSSGIPINHFKKQQNKCKIAKIMKNLKKIFGKLNFHS